MKTAIILSLLLASTAAFAAMPGPNFQPFIRTNAPYVTNAASFSQIWGVMSNSFFASTNSTSAFLSAPAAAAASSVSLTVAPFFGASQSGYLVVEAYTTNAELRAVSSISASNVNFATPLVYAHPSGAKVVWVGSGGVSASYFGCVADGSTDDTYGLLRGLWECSSAESAGQLYLEAGKRIILVNRPIPLPPNTWFKNAQVRAKSTFSPVQTTNAVLLGPCQGARMLFTATASDDWITLSSDYLNASPLGTKVSFFGPNLPTGMTEGQVYWLVTTNWTDHTKIQVSATPGGSVLNLTADGSGEAYTEIGAMTRCNLEGIYVYGNNVAGINGINLTIQQQSSIVDCRVDECPGYGWYIDNASQQGETWNLMAVRNGFLHFGGLAMHYTGFNVEQYYGLEITGSGNAFRGGHIESHLATTNAAVDLTGSQGFLLDNWIVGTGIDAAGVPTFRTDGASGTFNEIFWSSASADDGFMAIADATRSFTNYVYALAGWTSASRHLGHFSLPIIPSASSYPSVFGGDTVLGNDGQFEATAGQYNSGNLPFKVWSLPVTPGTNFLSVIMDTNGTTSAGLNKYGEFFGVSSFYPTNLSAVTVPSPTNNFGAGLSITNASFDIAGFNGLRTGQRAIWTHSWSNSAAGNITIGAPPKSFALGPASTNAQVVTQGKWVDWTFDVTLGVRSNYYNTGSQ